MLIRLFSEMYEQMTVDILQAAGGSTSKDSSVAIIGDSSNSMISYAIAEKIGAVYIETCEFPGWATRSFASFFWPWNPSISDGKGLRGTLNRLSYEPVGWISNFGLLPIVNRCRKKILGLPPVHFTGNYGKPAAMGIPSLNNFS
jgi:hypothetical protein